MEKRPWQFRTGDSRLAVTTLNGRLFSREHFVYDGAADGGLHRFRVYRELDPSQPAAGALTPEAFVIECDGRFRPHRYEAFSASRPVREIRFGDRDAEVLLSDGSNMALALERPELLLQINLIAPYAVLLPLLDGPRVEKTFFSVDAVVERPIVFLRGRRLLPWRPVRWFLENGSSFTLGAGGHVVSYATPAAKTGGTIVSAPFPALDFEALRAPRGSVYEPPPDIELRDVTIPSADVEVGAAFALPARRTGRVPAALLVQGSGQHDRHGISPAGDTGFHEIGDYLAAHGVATLRWDSRGIGGTPFGTTVSAWEALVGDARSALAWLREREEVLPDRVFVVGQSLGAIVALAIAHDEPPPYGLALLGPPGRPLGQVVIEQSARDARQSGLGRSGERTRRRTLAEILRTTAAQPHLSPLPLSDQRVVLEVDPAELAEDVRAPLLLCYGGRDHHIDVAHDAPRLAAAGAEQRLYPELDHLFRAPGSERVDVAFLESLLSWMKDRL